MTQEIIQVDAFTAEPFSGNPAAVCVLDKPASEEWMQRVATEMNLSETAFLSLEGEGYRLRWFTPQVEVDLCGHATLAAAHVLWESGRLTASETAQFLSRSGTLQARKEGEWIELDFPLEPAIEEVDPRPFDHALGVPVMKAVRNRFDTLLELSDGAELRTLTPDSTKLKSFGGRGIIVTSPDDTGTYDFLSRFFGPSVGIEEDPVTGSAHCFLGPYWAEKLDKQELTGYQASPRGGEVRVCISDDRARISGRAITVMRGELTGRAAEH